MTEYDRTPGDLIAGIGGRAIYRAFLVFKIAVDFVAGMFPENAEKRFRGHPQTSLTGGTSFPKAVSFHKRSRSDASHTYSNHFSLDFEQRNVLNMLDTSKISSLAKPEICCRSLCDKSTPCLTAVDTCTPIRPIYYRANSAGIQECKVPTTAHSYFASLSAFTAPMFAKLDCYKSDIIPTYSMQLYSIKTRYKHAPIPHSKLPGGSTVDSWISSAQTPPRLTPSTSFSTPSCGSSTPSSCASSVDRVFGTAPRRATPGILSTDYTHDTNQPLSIAFTASGNRLHGLPPVAVMHAAGSVSNTE